jgi:hypothetical protein
MWGLSFASMPSPYLYARWDRGSTTVTQSFDYIKQPHILADSWCYTHLTPSQRGYKTSISPHQENQKKPYSGLILT